MLQLKEKQLEGVLQLIISGRLDGVTSPEFEQKLDQLLAAGSSKVIIDCSALAFVSSAGLRVFLSFAKKIQKVKGVLMLAGLQPMVSDVFKLAGFFNFLKHFDTLDEALKQLTP